MGRSLTWLQVSLAGLGPQPGFAVLRVVQLGDEGEVAGHLAVVLDDNLLFLELAESHSLKLKL